MQGVRSREVGAGRLESPVGGGARKLSCVAREPARTGIFFWGMQKSLGPGPTGLATFERGGEASKGKTFQRKAEGKELWKGQSRGQGNSEGPASRGERSGRPRQAQRPRVGSSLAWDSKRGAFEKAQIAKTVKSQRAKKKRVAFRNGGHKNCEIAILRKREGAISNRDCSQTIIRR